MGEGLLGHPLKSLPCPPSAPRSTTLHPLISPSTPGSLPCCPNELKRSRGSGRRFHLLACSQAPCSRCCPYIPGSSPHHAPQLHGCSLHNLLPNPASPSVTGFGGGWLWALRGGVVCRDSRNSQRGEKTPYQYLLQSQADGAAGH